MPDPAKKVVFYVVAAVSASGKCVAFPVYDSGIEDRVIHNTLAVGANTGKLGVDFTRTVLAGSFNFVRIYTANDSDDAIARARQQGLKFEPITDVHARTMREIADAAKKAATSSVAATSNPLDDLLNGFARRPS